MKELTFVNGSLLFALLAGQSIIAKKFDGYDFHVLVSNPNAGENESHFNTHSTNNYAHKNPDFAHAKALPKDYDKAKAVRDFDNEVMAESLFKEKYPKPDHAYQDDLEQNLEQFNLRVLKFQIKAEGNNIDQCALDIEQLELRERALELEEIIAAFKKALSI